MLNAVKMFYLSGDMESAAGKAEQLLLVGALLHQKAFRYQLTASLYRYRTFH
jgi:hypothetical protein